MLPPKRETRETEHAELPTARTTLASHFRLVVMCRACHRIDDADLAKLVEQGKGDVPLIRLRFRCSNCRSRLCDAVVSGSHFKPQQKSPPQVDRRTTTFE